MCLQSAAVVRKGKPTLTHTLAISPETTETDIWECAVPVFAPKYARLELRASSDRDTAVILKHMLQSVRNNSPDLYMSPDWSAQKLSLIVQGGAGINSSLLQHQPAASNRQKAVKRGRDQARARGKASTVGQNTLLSTAASRRMRSISRLLLARSGNEEDEFSFLQYSKQPRWALQVVINLTSDTDGERTYEETKAFFKK